MSAQIVFAQVYDPAAAFEAGYIAKDNPTGVWTYGYSTSCTASPAIGYNNGAAFDDGNVAAARDQIILVSSVTQNLSTDLLFTAPSSGSYSLASSFMGDQRGIGVDVGVFENGSALFGFTVKSFGEVVSFDTTLNLVKEDVIEFAVEQGGGLQNTGLNLTITSAVPEPSATWLILCGIGCLVLFRRADSKACLFSVSCPTVNPVF